MATRLGEIYTQLELRDKQFNTATDSAVAKGQQLDTSLSKNTKSIGKNFTSLSQKYKQLEISAKTFGEESLLLQKKQDVLRSKMQSLIDRGANPATKGFQKLTAQYKTNQEELDKLSKQTQSSSKGFSLLKGLAIGAAIGIGTKFVSALGDAVDISIEAEETFNKFSVVFKDVDKEATKAAENLAKNFGLARDESQKLLANTGDLLTGFGFTGEAALDISNNVNTLAVDLASFTNIEGGATRASNALTKALLGERESAKELGIVIRETDIQSRLAKKGLDKLTGTARNQAIAVETLAIAQEQSKNAIGDYARSADSAANVNRRLAAAFRDLQADVGKEISGPLAELKLAFLDSSEGGSFFGDVLRGISEKIGQVIRGLTAVVRAINLISASFSEGITNTKLFTEAAAESGNTAKGYSLIAAAGGDVNKALFLLKKQAEAGDESAQKFLGALQKKSEESQKAAENTESALKKLDVSVQRFNETSEQRDKRLAAERKKTLDKLRKAKTTATDEAIKNDAKALKSRDKFVSDIAALGQSETDKIRQQEEERLRKVKELQQQRLISEKQAADLRVNINDDANQKIATSYANSINSALSTLSGFASQVGEIANLSSSNRLAKLDQDNEAELEALNTRYENEADLITKNVASQRQRDIQLKKLEEKRAAEEIKLQQKQEKERKKIEREAAITQKNLALFQTAVQIPQAAFAAFKSAQVLPFPASSIVGGTLAAAATALGLKKLQLISQQPIPKLADGGLALSASGGFPAIVGDNPRFDEVVAPLNDSLFNNIGAGVLKAVEDQATIETPEQKSFNLTVNVAGEQIFQNEIFFDSVTNGITNGEIIVDA